MGIASDLTALKTLSDGVVANKVSRFAYTEQAYIDNEVNGVIDYDVNRGRNIPVGTASVMKVNQTVIEKGWRARASSITRMLMNHFLGRISYNLNKVNDWFNTLLANLSASLGTVNGIATLDENGKVPATQLVESDVPASESTAIFTANGAYDFFGNTVDSRTWLARVFGTRLLKAIKKSEGITEGTQIGSLCHADNLWVAGSIGISQTGAKRGIWWSEDNCRTWSFGAHNTSTHLDMVVVRRILHENGLWVATVDTDNSFYTGMEIGLWWSEDGKTWNTCTGLPSENGYGGSDGLCYANGLWVAGTANKGVWWSEDGKNWTQGTGFIIGSAYPRVYDIKYNNGLWVLGSLSNQGLWWSEDGKNWTQVSVSTSYVNCVEYLNGMWLAGCHKSIFWSTNGKDWTKTTTSSLDDVNVECFTFANGLFLAGTTSNGVYRSDNGKTWHTTSTTFSVIRRCLTYANGLYVAGLMSSEDSINWVSNFGNYINSESVFALLCANGTWALGTNTGIKYSDYESLEF